MTGFSADGQQVIELTNDPATWPADIKSQCEDIRKMPGTPKEPVIEAIKKLAKNGTHARFALASLADDGALPEPHRAMSGIFSAYFIRYDVNALRVTAEGTKNPFMQRQSIEFLADIGGSQNRAFLDALAKNVMPLSAYIGHLLAKFPVNESITEDNRRGLQNILLKSTNGKMPSVISIAFLNEGKSTVDSSLESLVLSPVSDEDTQMHAAMALVKIHKQSVPELANFCARNKHRYIRYNAIQELSQHGPAGEAVLNGLLATPDEPLRRHIESKLGKK